MRRPVIGIIGNSALLGDDYPAHAGGTMNSQAVAEVARAMPLLIPADPHFVDVDELLEVFDGFPEGALIFRDTNDHGFYLHMPVVTRARKAKEPKPRKT